MELRLLLVIVILLPITFITIVVLIVIIWSIALMSLCLLLLPLFFVQLLFTVLFHALHHLIQRQFARVFLDLFNLWFDLFLSLRWLLLCCRQRHLLVGLMGVLCTWNKILRHRHDDRTTRDNSARWNLWLRLLGHVCLRLLRLRLIIGYILFFLLCYWS